MNPGATKAYGSFKIRTYTKEGYILDAIDNSVSVSMTQTVAFKEIMIERSNKKNG